MDNKKKVLFRYKNNPFIAIIILFIIAFFLDPTLFPKVWGLLVCFIIAFILYDLIRYEYLPRRRERNKKPNTNKPINLDPSHPDFDDEEPQI